MTIETRRLRVVQTAHVSDLLSIHRVVPSLLLGGYGLFVVSLYFRGLMTWYINPTYVLPATVAGGVLIALAIIRLARPVTSTCEDGCDGGDCDCASPRRLWVYGVLAVPLALGFLLPAHSLAAFSARQRGPEIAGLTAIHGTSSIHRMTLAVDTSTYTLQDWVGALSSDPNPADYRHKPVILTGMVIHAPGSVPPGYVMVLRYQVTCCIADAKPEGLIVKDTSHGTLHDNQWVTVHGTMGGTSYQGQQVAVVEPHTIELVKAGNPYMY